MRVWVAGVQELIYRDQEISKYVCFHVIVLFNENLNPWTLSRPILIHLRQFLFRFRDQILVKENLMKKRKVSPLCPSIRPNSAK